MFKRDYTIIITADNNEEVYWKILKKGKPAAYTKDDAGIIEEMLDSVKHNLEVERFWRQSKEQEKNNGKSL